MTNDHTPALYKFHWDGGRMGDLEGIFVATPAEIEAVIGRTAIFGEVLGKHSDIRGQLEAKDFTKIETTLGFATEYQRIFVSTGFNPFSYLACEECGVEEDDCQCPEVPGPTDSKESRKGGSEVPSPE